MKMKAVCEATSLTDRTIRYYIEEKLIFPTYTENYLGRKAFDFSESDIQKLNDIAVLRKYGFSIPEIKEMLVDPARIIPIAQKLQARKQTSVSQEQALLSALSRLDVAAEYTVSSLAAILSNPASETPLPPEEIPLSRQILLLVKRICIPLIICFPVLLAVKAVYNYRSWYQYPVFSNRVILMIVVLLLPSLLILLASRLRLKPKPRRVITTVLLIFCVLSTPINYVLTCFSFTGSETSNHHNYRRFDANCLVNRDSVFQALFPAWPEYSDTEYYYSYSEGLFGNTCDVYAQWSLDAEAFAAEVSRIHALYESAEYSLDRLAVQKGEYTCLVMYSGSPPFEAATEDYAYYIFAYHEQSRTVRYIHCYSQVHGADQPYYLSLDW